MSQPRIGWIGLGAMGGPMAEQLARNGFAVTGFDPAVRGRDGVSDAADAAAAVTDAEVVGLMVATPAQVHAVLDQVIDTLAPGTVVVVFATIGTEAAEQVAARLAERDLAMVDAPVSGGSVRAGTGELLLMVGGDPVALERARPMLAALGTVHVVGPQSSDGQRLKLVNQLLCGVHVAVAGEALAYAEAMGLDPRVCWEVLRGGAAQSFMFADRGARMLDYPEVPVSSAVDIIAKDLGLVADAAAGVNQPVPLAAAALDLFRSGQAEGLGRTDDSAMVEVARRARTAGEPAPPA
ncbi:hydroxyacid dehydrogenase [Enemella dayhoffiae]|uniref:Hydroxyacid dehydrogenase n=1 Tax=Enemella dayhoffiae TaxID=2016507 RepID=A0A255HBY9_9ACTN|nr:NAD(P)-dependent oxidoreductase [Enemella dayhoffiae]OYO25279.1 hydroxyacid dehydrogenase [Enemella dayhoffiae]